MEYFRNIGKKIGYGLGILAFGASMLSSPLYADSPIEKIIKWPWRGVALPIVDLVIATPCKAIEKHGLSGKTLVEITLGAPANAFSRASAAAGDATVCSLDETPLYNRNGEVIELGEDSALKANVVNAIADPFKAD